MTKVLVTGANGFLGKWLVNKLIEDKNDVSVLLRNTTNTKYFESLNCHILIGDVTDKQSLTRAFQGIDCVFHLAGVIAYKASDRPLMERVNVIGTQNVVDACVENKVGFLLHMSSVVTIGAGLSSKMVLNEDSKFNISDLNLGYFETKKSAEEIVIKAFKEKKLTCVIVNPSTIYGAGDATKGSRKTQLKVANGTFPFYTNGGVNVVPASDVINGILLAWKKGRPGERYILAGENITIKKLFEIIANAAGVSAPKILLPNWVLHFLGFFGDIFEKMGFKSSFSSENAWTATLFHWFDSSKAKRELGFVAGSAESAIKESVLWSKNQGLLK